MKAFFVRASLLASTACLAACGSSGDDGRTARASCTEGELISCVCTSGAMGTQACLADGTLGTCTCGTGTPTPGGPIPTSTGTSSPPRDPTGAPPPDPTGTPPPDPTGTPPPDPTGDPPPDPPPPSGGSGCGNTSFPPPGGGVMDVLGVAREYTVTLPPGYDPNVPYKLVFVWHPLGGNQGSIVSGGYMGFEGLAAGTAIFATGQGLPFGGSLPGWGDPNDVPFARQLLDHITQNYCVDEARIFSSGFSFGAIMSNKIGCEIGDRVRAIAPMSGSGPAPAPCVGSTAVWISHSNPDPVVPYDSGLQSLNYWVGANGCSQNTVPTGVDTCVEYQGCRPEAPIVWCSRTTGGHSPPSYGVGEAWAFFLRF